MEAAFSDQSRGGKLIRALILYPSDSAGSDVPLAQPAGEGFPVIVFGHGYMMPVEAYRNIWECTVPKGFVFVLPESGSGLFPSHLEFGLDMAFILDEMIRLSSDTTSLFSGRLLPSGCLMGHSMGGGAAVLGTAAGKSAKALILLAPLDTRPSAVEAAKKISVPSLVFAGSDDRVTPPKKHQLPIYDSLISRCKTYISIIGGNHCQMAENNRLCNFAEGSYDNKPLITREEQHIILSRYIIPWLYFHLYGDISAGHEFRQLLDSDTAILYKREDSLADINR